MNKFSEKLANFLAPIATKFSTQRHLCAIRDGFITLMPLVIVASLFVLLNNVVLDGNIGLLKSFKLDEYKDIGVSVYYGTLGFLSVLLAATVSYKLASSYKMDELGTTVVSVAALATLIPTTIVTADNVTISGVFSEIYTSPTGLFVAVIVAILATEILRKLNSIDKLKIKMPESVPPTVSKSFNLLIPSFITLTLFAVVAFIFTQYVGTNVYDVITKLIQAPIKAVFQGLPGIVIVLLIQNLLWSFGLHGAFILSPITEPTLLTAIQENMAAFQIGADIPNIVTKPFLDAFAFLGGGGCTIGLVIAILIASKKPQYKSVTKLGFIPSLFNINEPLMFGLPVVLNPLFMIPLVLVPIVNVVIAYIATASGLISKTVVMVPWTTPPILSAYLSTAGDIRAALLAAGLIVLSVFIYLPFVLASNKVKDVEEEGSDFDEEDFIL
ncbi:PTS sugar transporter subunit IIC [Paraclostridium bifermentans]|uniref:PTS sugar transporter subunit IIC n=1 Tax=Paraclostridium bifermentans TaxID=1490 RepID=UPI0018AC18EE|nr:PTS sugar transporter subunit IIC [Paraclostridium bifermentans]